MKLYRYLFILVGLLFASCEYDYDMDLGEFTPQVVLNSVINPDSTIKVSLLWSNYVDNTSEYKKVEKFTTKLYEDNNIIIDQEGVDGLLLTKHYPKEGSQYRLEIEVPNYGKLSAETSIPSAPKVEVEYTGFAAIPASEWGPMQYQYHYFSINKIEPSTTTRSVMIRAMGFYEELAPELSYNLYANNLFCDQFNAVNDTHDVTLRGSSVGYELYIRVPYKNIEQAMPLNFSVSDFPTYSKDIPIGHDDLGYPIYESKSLKPSHIVVEIISPSNQYDKYYKSAYQQVILGDIDPQLFRNILPISSNVENGLGIFAGHSSAIFKAELKYDE